MDLFAALSDVGINPAQLRNFRPGVTAHILCPSCGGGRTKEKSLAITIDDDSQGAVWTCHRGTCSGFQKNFVRLAPRWEAPPKPKPAHQFPMRDHAETQKFDRPDWFCGFFNDRRIGERVLKLFGVYPAERSFPGLGRRPAILFPYTHRGVLVTRKYRPFPEKSPQSQESGEGAKPILYNADAIDTFDTLIWVEGEPDVLAMAECGFMNAVSLRDGAPSEAKFRADDKRFAALTTHAEGLSKITRHILAGDTDKPGLALREELARRLGRLKVMTVDWPEGCKDAGDVLRKHGPDAVKEAVADARYHPIAGIIELEEDEFLALLDERPAPTMTTGLSSTDGILRLPTEGKIIVVTGQPNHGKSEWMRFIMIHTMRQHDRRWLVFAPEDMPTAFYVQACTTTYHGKWHTRLTLEEKREAARFFVNHLTLLALQTDQTETTTVDWVVERMKVCCLRYGITDFLIDPWNEIDHARGTMTETDYTARSLQRLRIIAAEHGCNIWIIAHPAKPMAANVKTPPGIYDPSGSAHWANKPDLMITVWQPEYGLSDIILSKVRHSQQWGRRLSTARIEFDSHTRRYKNPEVSPGIGDPPARQHWQDDD